MPPPKKHHGPHHRHKTVSAATRIFDRTRIEAMFSVWVPDAHDREFLVRCVLDEGPVHHRGANYVLLSLLADVLAAVGGTARADDTMLGVEMRLPPHLEDEMPAQPYPMKLSTAAVKRVAPASRDHDTLVDLIGDGPPQHVVANIAMVNLLEAILSTLERRPATVPE